LRLLPAREVDEDAVVRLDHGIAVDRLAAFERAARHRRHAYDRPGSVEGDAVIAAGDVVGIDLAAREPRAAMRAVVLQALQLAAAVAPQHEISPERLHRMRLAGLDLHRLCHRVPLAEDAGGEAFFDAISVDAAHLRACLNPQPRPSGA